MKSPTWKSYLKEHLSLYIFVGVLFVMGIVFGTVTVNALSLEQKQEMMNYLSSFFNSINDGSLNLEGQNVFISVLTMHLKWIVLIWVLGLSIVGIPLLLILDFLKGVMIGFTVGYLAGQLSWKGILFALVSVAPQNMIVVPMLIVCSVSAISFAIYMVKNRLLTSRGNVMQPLMKFTSIAVTSCLIVTLVSLYEGFVSPYLMRWVTPMLNTL
ncbi:stage II sporulation protein M [Paenibacillus sp. N1-5-1-14]|uniref:stage II sporulation protein M n=1 Tax=Paenibacillus radicibacter TaxID=2972488 RepID=UPI002158A777|nr:stage II sporulation protein M [Paenibacillus radicibacter]MCR8642379.1 stage II sporulation protein M [Paenibacillus radicibacter]